MYGRQMRSTVRLKAGDTGGSVVLRRLNAPLIICDLQDISEMGCRCLARVRINDWTDAEKWRTVLRTGELYEAEITFDPYIPFIRLPIEIRSSIALPANGYELGLAFFDLEPDHRQMLNKAMISIATEKIRQSKGVLKRDTPNIPAKTAPPVLPIAARRRLSASTERSTLRPADALDAEDVQKRSLQRATEPVEESASVQGRDLADLQSSSGDPTQTRQITQTMQTAPQELEYPVEPEIPAAEAEPADQAGFYEPPEAQEQPRQTQTGAFDPIQTEPFDPAQTQPEQQPAARPERLYRHGPKLGEVLSRSGHLSRGEVASAVFSAREKGEKLGEYLVREGVMTPLQILQARSAQTGLAYVDFDMHKIQMELLDLFPFSKMKRFDFVPFEMEGETVRIACANPIAKMELDGLERICGKRIESYLCREDLPRTFLDGVARRFDRYRRAHPRYKVSLPASFQCCSPEGPLLSDALFRGRTIDISEGGMQVSGPVLIGFDPQMLSPGMLRMMVTVGAVPQDIVGVCETRHIRYVRTNGGGTTCIYGLKLDDMSEPHRDILQGLIARVTRAQHGINDDAIETATPMADEDRESGVG